MKPNLTDCLRSVFNATEVVESQMDVVTLHLPPTCAEVESFAACKKAIKQAVKSAGFKAEKNVDGTDLFPSYGHDNGVPMFCVYRHNGEEDYIAACIQLSGTAEAPELRVTYS